MMQAYIPVFERPRLNDPRFQRNNQAKVQSYVKRADEEKEKGEEEGMEEEEEEEEEARPESLDTFVMA